MARRRFIAGAICPACGIEDRIYVLPAGTGDSGPSRHCSACDFSERLQDQVEPDAAAVVWQPVRLPE